MVAGKGIQLLKNAGCNVITGVLEEECRAHHKRFFTVQEKKRPFIILKWAATKDGFISPKLDLGLTSEISKKIKNNNPIWITNTYSQQLVHKWRSEEHAILVGTNTVIADNPRLNVRSWNGESPIRVILDRNLRIPENANVLDGSVKTIMITAKGKQQKANSKEQVVFEFIDFSKNLAKQICKVLYKHKIQSIIIEGGNQTLQTLIDESLWDEARVFKSDKTFEKGIKTPQFTKTYFKETHIKNDTLKIYKNA